jgi:hypothetical protein
MPMPLRLLITLLVTDVEADRASPDASHAAMTGTYSLVPSVLTPAL